MSLKVWLYPTSSSAAAAAGAAAAAPSFVVTNIPSSTRPNSPPSSSTAASSSSSAEEEQEQPVSSTMEGHGSRLMAPHHYQHPSTISRGWTAGGHMPWPVTTAMAGCTKRNLGSSVLLTTLLLVLVSAALVPTPATATAQGYSGSQREDIPDFYDDYLSEDGNAYLSAEVGRLLKEHAENRDFVNSLDAQYYQITYPVQLQRQGKSQGISTRDASQITVGPFAV
ncbi:uncharacterized protein [Palaemon carinicauda]|uniref:uncharacterized protein n=1 Tax=Palaemon carinicauda TaxID=392227 RepID=UPI0035B65B62